jgi:putative ABC transport system substrate-binding protein
VSDKFVLRNSLWLISALLLACVQPVQAQQPTKIHRIAYLSGNSPSANVARIEAFRQGLRELGYVEGKNITIEYRYAEGQFERLPDLAAEIIRLKIDVIVALSTPC